MVPTIGHKTKEKQVWDGTVGMLCDHCKSSMKNGGSCPGCPYCERKELCEVLLEMTSHEICPSAKNGPRIIGIAGVKCFDGPCKPWSKTPAVCGGCAIRPMKVYQGNSGAIKVVDWLFENGFGTLISPGWWKTPERFPYYCLDNGAFPAWFNDRTWDEAMFLKLIGKAEKAITKPDFVVCPDKVAAGKASLNFSLDWIEKLPTDLRYYLAVQNGMTVEDVKQVLSKFSGLFVGGTMDWKLETSEQWIALAHKHNKPCHIGRIGPWQRILWAARIGADSIDSTTWTRFQDRRYHLEYAKSQAMMEAF